MMRIAALFTVSFVLVWAFGVCAAAIAAGVIVRQQRKLREQSGDERADGDKSFHFGGDF